MSSRELKIQSLIEQMNQILNNTFLEPEEREHLAEFSISKFFQISAVEEFFEEEQSTPKVKSFKEMTNWYGH